MVQVQKMLPKWAWWLMIASIWIILYYTDWVSIINNHFLQTMAGFILFLVPGAICGILYYGEIKWTQLFTLGIVFSSFIALVLAICSIIFGLSSYTFHLLFALASTVSFVLLILRRDQVSIQRWEHFSLTRLEIVLFGLGIISTLGLLLVMSDMSAIDGDYQTYNAMITEFSETSTMSLQDPFLGTHALIKTRLWLIAWVVDQSLIVQFSQLNILQIFSHINLLLVFLVQIAIYDLMRCFDIPRKFAFTASVFTIFAILTQLYNGEIGEVFIHRLAQDKVVTAWVLAPIVVRAIYDFLREGNRRNGLFVIIVSFVTVNFHAVTFFYIAMIVGSFSLLYVTIQSHKWQHIIFVGLTMILLFFIPFTLKQLAPDDFIYEVVDIASSGQEPQAFARLAMSSDDQVLYGIAPYLREGLAFTIVYLATAIAVIYIQHSALGYYIIACSIVLLSVSNPITAPLIAKLITPFQLWRVTWIIPFGIAGAVVLQEIYRHLDKLSKIATKIVLLVIVAGFTIVNIDLTNNYVQDRLANPPKNSYSQKQALYSNLIEASNLIKLDTQSETTRVFADNPIMYLIPSLSENLYALIWHNDSQIRLTAEEQLEREIDHNRFYADDITLEEFHELLDKYDIEYLVLSSTFIRPLNSLLENSPRVAGKHTFGQINVWVINTE